MQVECSRLEHHAPIFIVDDDESVRISLARLLRAEGMDSVTFADAESFLRFLENAPPAQRASSGCAIIDFHLPGMSGIELAMFLKREYPGIHAILITGSRDSQVDALAAKAGVALLHKPIGDEIFAAITPPCPPQTGVGTIDMSARPTI